MKLALQLLLTLPLWAIASIICALAAIVLLPFVAVWAVFQHDQ